MKYLRAKRATYFGNLKTLERTHGFRIFHVSTWILVVKMILIILLYMVATNSVEIAEYKPIGDTDFILLVDDSSSMSATDFQPNRLASAKNIASRWLAIVPNSTQIGVIGFSNNIDVEAPLSVDKKPIYAALNSMEIDYKKSGTNLDFAIGYGINMFKDSSNKKKNILLFTDGTQNVSESTIQNAIDQEVKITIFGIGSELQEARTIDYTDIPEELRNTYSDLNLNISILKSIAEQTGGQAYLISNEMQLEESFQDATLEQISVRINSAYYVTLFIAFMSILELVIFARVGAL
ncbi:VWA domain-containing protein [Candidatus Woesearchaeota archaeon]|nr:VWA domain-containing protein [Candidatus Woesearchaeota archaeon]